MDQLTMFGRTTERLANRVGYGHKQRHKTITPNVAAWMLRESNYLIRFDPAEAKRVGYHNLWQFLAWRFPMGESFCPLAAPNEVQQVDSMRRYARDVRSGFVQLRKALQRDSCRALFMVPRNPDGKNIEVITLDPDYPVNEAGMTASQLADRRERKRSRGGLQTTIEKRAAIRGSQDVLDVLAAEILQDLQEIRARGLPAPLLSPESAIRAVEFGPEP